MPWSVLACKRDLAQVHHQVQLIEGVYPGFAPAAIFALWQVVDAGFIQVAVHPGGKTRHQIAVALGQPVKEIRLESLLVLPLR